MASSHSASRPSTSGRPGYPGVSSLFRSPRGRARVAQVGIMVVALGGMGGFAYTHKSVALDVDGQVTHVRTYAASVGDVLESQGVDVGEHDLVAPRVNQPVPQGGEIVVRTAKQVSVTVDGQEKDVWTTAETVDGLLDDIGVRQADALTSVSRSSRVEGSVEVSTPKSVEVIVNGEAHDGVTAAPTVREALDEMGIALTDDDQVSVALDAPVVDGLPIIITRPVVADASETTTQDFQKIEKEDDTLLKGTTKVEQEGKQGTRQITYRSVTMDGVEVGRDIIASVTIDEPQDEIVLIGTKEPPKTPSVPATNLPSDPASAKGIALEMVRAAGLGDDQYACLEALWTRESGWRVNASNRSSGAYGIPQALPGSKMAKFGADWQTNPRTQIAWGLSYISGRYGTPCGAWGAFQSKGWY